MSLPLYFVECRGRSGNRFFLELDRDDNSAGAVRCLIRHDDSVIKVLEVCEDEGTCRDVTEDITREALAGVVREREPADQQAARFDHQHDLRKNYEPAE
jgi:hypothetical protein